MPSEKVPLNPSTWRYLSIIYAARPCASPLALERRQIPYLVADINFYTLNLAITLVVSEIIRVIII
jgi:hypothetical protein